MFCIRPVGARSISAPLQSALAAIKGNVLAKPNYQFEKHQRDLAKKRKQEEKRHRKLGGKTAVDDSGSDVAADPSDAAALVPSRGRSGPG